MMKARLWKLEIEDGEACLVVANTLAQAIEVYCKQTGLLEASKLVGCGLLNDNVLMDKN